MESRWITRRIWITLQVHIKRESTRVLCNIQLCVFSRGSGGGGWVIGKGVGDLVRLFEEFRLKNSSTC